MEQDDEEFEQLLGEIPRATSAPPHLEELQRAYGAELNNSPFVASVGEGGHSLPPVKPFIDIRCDEHYENFYRAYSGAKKLPPPMENRSLYAEHPTTTSPKSNSNNLSPFFSGLVLDSPRCVVGLRPRLKHELISSQISADHNSISNSAKTSSSSSDHRHPPQPCLSAEDRPVSSAFGNLSFDKSTGGLTGGRHLEESGVGGDCRVTASNGGVDNGVVVASKPNGRGTPMSTGFYSHLNPFSAEFGSESAALVEALVNRSSSAKMEFFSMANTGCVAMGATSNGSCGIVEGFDGQAAEALEKYLRRASPARHNNGGMDGFGTNCSVAVQQQQYDTAYVMHPIVSSSSVNGNEVYPNSVMDYSASAAQSLQHQAHRMEFQLEAEKRVRERQYNQIQQQQQMRFYASLHGRANGDMGNGAKAFLSSRGGSPIESPTRQSLLHHHVTGASGNQTKNSRSQEQLWNVRGGEVSNGNAELGRNSFSTNGVCRYFVQGYCSRGDACPFVHAPSQAFGSGRCTNARETSREKRQLSEKMLVRSRVVSQTSNGRPAQPADSLQRRKPEDVANGSTLPIDGLVYLNGSHHLSPVEFHEVVQPHVQLECTLEHGSSRHPILGTQHLSPQSQQSKYNTLEEVEGKIFSIAKDQHGCRFLQRKFDEGSPEDVQKIFNEIIDHIIELMTDPFGNYLVQKLLEVCDEAQRMEILHVVTGKGELVTISLNMHGTRAVQKLIETLKSSEQVGMVTASLKPGVVTLIKDLNGNHVVQRCLQRLSTENSQFIFDTAALHCVEIATHRHGCCVLQRCVDFSSGAQRHRLVAEIAANALVLSQDPFGNYVVQYVLDLGLTWVSVEVMVRLETHYSYLAMQKFSSNVVEKCLKLATDENRGRIVRELTGSPRLGQMLQDPYANYVVQSALTVAKGSVHTGLVEAIRPHLSILRSSPYGKRILSRTNLKK